MAEVDGVKGSTVSNSVWFDSSFSESDSEECEGIPQQKIKRKKLPLPKFAKECDRFKVSNRAGAALANANLKDHGMITKEDTSMMIDHSKLRRERIKAGQLSEKKNKTENSLVRLCTLIAQLW